MQAQVICICVAFATSVETQLMIENCGRFKAITGDKKAYFVVPSSMPESVRNRSTFVQQSSHQAISKQIFQVKCPAQRP